MNTKSTFLTAVCAALLSACGGGSNETTSGRTIEATKGMFVGGTFGNFFNPVAPYFQVVLENGETWVVYEYNPRGEPIFFANGSLRFTDRVVTTVSGSQTTTTTTTTPDRTVSESSTVTTDTTSPGGFQSVTNFKSVDALITINSNLIGASEFTYTESLERNIPIANSPESVGTSEFRQRALVLAPPPIQQFNSGVRVGLDPTSIFAYDRPADVQRLAGTWTFIFNRTNASMVVSTNGAFNGTNQVTGCAFSGTLIPHPNGKNVFTSSVTVTDCPDSGSYRGIAATYPQPEVRTASGELVPAIFLAALNTSKSRVFSFSMFRRAE